MKKYIACVDAGTSGERCLIYDLTGNAVGEGYFEVASIYPRNGWAEQDPVTTVEMAIKAVAAAVAGADIDPADIAAISFCTQQTTFAAIDRDGNYLTNAILWQDCRGMESFGHIQESLAAEGLTLDDLMKRSGHLMDTMSAGPKIVWIRDNLPEIYEKTWKFVTPMSMLVKAFGGEDWYDDEGSKYWWMTRDIETGEYDEKLLRVMGRDADKYPPFLPTGACAGHVSEEIAARTGLVAGTPILMGATDQICAAIGAGNYGSPDIGSLCLGTVGVVLTYAPRAVVPEGGSQLVGYPGGGMALEAGIAVAATALRWLRGLLYPEDYSTEGLFDEMLAEAAKSPVGANCVSFIPHLIGAATPVNDPNVRGCFVGMSLGTSRADLMRACVEGVCFEMRDVLESCRRQGIANYKKFRVIGGAVRSDFWNQMQADVYNCPVETVTAVEVPALGLAITTAVGAGLYPSMQEACEQMITVKQRYEPNPEAARLYDEFFAIYQSSIRDLRRETFPGLAELRSREGM